ncbi:hypothetical protein [Mycobacterium asiaticum]|uniref:PE domain-containing protein n=1 Tax=Mycobacterium asiaticum TaxID=1790 RepID=A0A1A3MWV0_MYCAS|nr:hypothetical protein [Mycobacterium asiaticum]OBK12637.1 hypothetical protein A5636_11580 [Mycobacterium asiaticum]
MGSNELQVGLDELRATAAQWQGLSAQFTEPVPPSPGQPFQPTTAALNTVNAAVRAAAASLLARTEATADGLVSAAGQYGIQEATSTADMSNVPQVAVA